MLGISGFLAGPTQAQQKVGVRRVGILMPFQQSDAAVQGFVRVFRQELLRLGWSEGSNVRFEERWSADKMDGVRADAANLIELKPDVILILGDRVIPVFMKLTSSIPIVVAAVSDPIASGAAESLARPGHNVTGFSLIEFSMFGKMLEISKQIAPRISRVGMMYNPDNSVGVTYRRWFEIERRTTWDSADQFAYSRRCRHRTRHRRYGGTAGWRYSSSARSDDRHTPYTGRDLNGSPPRPGNLL